MSPLTSTTGRQPVGHPPGPSAGAPPAAGAPSEPTTAERPAPAGIQVNSAIAATEIQPTRSPSATTPTAPDSGTNQRAARIAGRGPSTGLRSATIVPVHPSGLGS